MKKTTPSWLQDAIMHRVSVNVHSQQEDSVKISSVTLYSLYYCLRKINHLVLVTICIHPLMYVKPCREQEISHILNVFLIVFGDSRN